jgi:putative endonuclease
MYYTYVLRSIRDKKLYIGYTSNLQRRFAEHQMGESTSTACRRPFQLIFYEAFLDKKSAKRRESYFKTAKGKTTLKQMLKETLLDETSVDS